MRKTVEVQMDAGMEARPIALMVQTANQFSSHLYLEMDGKHVNAKSIMRSEERRVGKECRSRWSPYH